MCDFEVQWEEQDLLRYGLNFNYKLLEELQNDKIIDFNSKGIVVRDNGKEYVRVICSAIDLNIGTSLFNSFSQSI
jgi:hypothetical protein